MEEDAGREIYPSKKTKENERKIQRLYTSQREKYYRYQPYLEEIVAFH